MSFSSIIQKYFINLFIVVVAEDDSYRVLCKAIKNSKQEEKFEKIFPVKPNAEFLNEELENYLISLQDKYNYTYITFLLDSMGQGAIKGVQAEDFSKFSVDSKNIKTVKFDTWSAYVSFIDINWINKIYSNVGLDFIYSPFVILYHLLAQHKLKVKSTLYLLNQKDSITLAVFKENTLCFGVFYKIIVEDGLDNTGDIENWEDEEEAEDVEKLAALDEESQKNEEEELTDLSELDTLESDYESDEFIDAVDSQDDEDVDDASIEDIALYGRDLHIFKFLSRALKEYYNNPVYESDFLEKMVIFDGYDMSKEIVASLEDDLYLDLEMHKVDVNEVVCNLCIGEVYDQL
jgi:hypothetical protein